MDIEKLIHCLQCCARVDAHNIGCDDCGLEYCGPECQQLCGTAATALSTLQAENKRLNKIVCSIPTTPDSGRTVSQYDKEMSMCAYLDDLEAENESLKEKLYDGEGVNLVDYWMQQAKIEENGHRNCQAENEKLRAELEQMKWERDAAVERIREWEKFDTYLFVHNFITPEKWRGQKEG